MCEPIKSIRICDVHSLPRRMDLLNFGVSFIMENRHTRSALSLFNLKNKKKHFHQWLLTLFQIYYEFQQLKIVFVFLPFQATTASSKTGAHDLNIFRVSCTCEDCLKYRETIILLVLEDYEYNTLWKRLQMLIRRFYDLIPE